MYSFIEYNFFKGCVMSMTPFYVLGAAGFLISLYTYLTEQKLKKDPTFKPVCDLSDRVSCSKPMQSQYANFFMISNGIAGMAFFALIIEFAYMGAHTLLLLVSLGGCIFSCILGYLLFVKVKVMCLLCTFIYIINFGLLYLSFALR